MEVGGLLSLERTMIRVALFRGPKPLKTKRSKSFKLITRLELFHPTSPPCHLDLPILNNCLVLPVVVGMHLHIARTNVHLITVLVHAVVVRVLVVMLALPVLNAAVVRRREPIEPILERLLALLVPFEVPDDFVLLVQDLPPAEGVVAVEVLVQVLVLALFLVAVVARGVPLNQSIVFCKRRNKDDRDGKL